jgi:O-antigen/teichoic acid export membrane protein
MAVSEHSKEIAKGAFWNLAGSAGVKLIGFFYLVLLARMAPQEDVGTFYLALSIFGMISVLADFGLPMAFTRYTPYLISRNETDKLLTLLKISYAVVSILAILGGAIIFLSADSLSNKNPQLAQTLRILSPYLLLSVLFNMNIGFLGGKKKMKEQSVLLTTQTIAKLFLTVAFFFFIGATILSIAAGFVLSFLAVVIISFFYVRAELAGLPASTGGTNATELMREVLPFGLALSVVTYLWAIVGYLDRIMIGYMLDPAISAATVAVYSMATSLSGLIMIFPGAIAAIFLPIISAFIGQDKKEETSNACETSLRWMIFVTFPLTLVMIAFPDSILRMFYGDSYAIGGFAMAVFSAGLFIRSISLTQSLVLAGMRMVGIELKVVAVAAFVNVLLNLFLIPSYGMNGAAVASAVAFIIATILFVYYSRKIVSFRIPPEAYKAFISGMIALALIFVIRPYLSGMLGQLPSFGEGDMALLISNIVRLLAFGLLFIIALAVYVTVLFFLKSFHSDDIEILGAALRRGKMPENWVSGLSAFLDKGIHS